VEGDLQRQLGANLRALRLKRGLSQEAMADLLGIHRTYIGGLERGERNVTLRTVERLAVQLDVEPRELLKTPAPSRSARPSASGRRSARTGRRQASG
jgi:transcriptional regulator with XRE-family HTH domain